MIQRALLPAASAVLFLVPSAPAQDVRIINSANVARKQWVDIAVPVTDGLALPDFCTLEPQGFPVWKGRHVGLHSTMFHAYVAIGANRMLEGRLVGRSLAPHEVPAFGMSDWIADDTVGVIPKPAVFSGGREHRLGPVSFARIESGPARQVFHLRGRINGTPLAFEEWLYVYSHQDVVEFEMTLTNSDPRTPELTFQFDLAWMETREFPQFDFRTGQGMFAPKFQTAIVPHPSYGHWVQALSGPRVMGRGEQLFFSGSILCQAAPGRTLEPMSYQAGSAQVHLSVADRGATLLATARGSLDAVWTDWDGKWLAFGMVPELPAGARNGGWDEANASASAFRSLMLSPHDLYDQRPRGLLQRAGSTGAQEDFGASKAILAVSVGDPRFLQELGYSTYEMFGRPFHHREVDGSPVLQRNHPGLRTWSQIVHCQTTNDTLGLICPFPYSWPSNGWSGIDDQHRSQNNANALLALSGSYALHAAFKDLLEMDLCQVPGRIDSPRGEGRLMMAWANMLMLLDDPFDRVRLHQHMSDRVGVALNRWPGRRFLGDPHRPIRVLGVGSDPTFRDPLGNSIPAIIVWEHSIAAMGYFAAWRLTGDDRYRLLAAELSKLIVNHCIFQENGQWVSCVAVRYLQGADEGRALPASAYYTGSPDIHLGISFWTWIHPAVLICRELHRHVDPGLVARCQQIIAWMGPPNSWQRAEWWAVAPR